MHPITVRALPILLAASAAAYAQDFSSILSDISKQNNRNAKVTGLRFNCAPSADCKVRPFENLQIQVLVDGESVRKDGTTAKGRLRRAPGLLKVADKNGGAVSKPFKFQGKDPGGFVETASGTLGSIFSQVSGDFTVFDTFLYIAPEKPGTYTLECDTEGVKGEVKVTVDANAASTKPAEQFAFKTEDKTQEKYRALAEKYAPVFAQETWWTPKADYPTRWDYDNDFAGDNNWDNLDKGTSQAYIYYAVMETATHWFLIYNAFHPRDYSDKCMAGSCHENDNEGAILVVRKDGTEFGKLLAMETLAHNNLYSYTTESGIGSGIHSIEGRMLLRDQSHPVIFIESGGHGMYGGNDPKHSRYRPDSDDFGSPAGTGVTFVYKGTAERPRHSNDRNVGYELLPILTHWWSRAGDEQLRMYDEFAPYEPWGGRPGSKLKMMGKTFYGRKESSNKAKPFWGWHDTKTLKAKVLNAGQWGLDPAYAFSKNLSFSGAWSLDYTYNPYLGIGEDSVSTSSAAVDAITPATPATTNQVAGNVSGSLLPPLGGGAAAVAPAVVNEGYIDIAANVDGTVVFHLFESTAAPEVLAGQPITGQKVQFSAPIPAAAGATWTVEKKKGRGKVEITEQPSEANGYTVNVKVEDPSRGAADYEFRVKWNRAK